MTTTITIPDHLPDYDFLELVMFDNKVGREGFAYAAANYGPRFEFADYQDLTARQVREIHDRFRADVEAWWLAHPDDGCDLHNAHVDESRRRQEHRALWAVRWDNGNVSGCGSQQEATGLCTEPSWRGVQVLNRSKPGGEWTVVADFRGREEDSEWTWVKVGDEVLVDGRWLKVVDEGEDVRTIGRTPYHFKYRLLADGRRVEPPLGDEPKVTVRIRRRIPDTV